MESELATKFNVWLGSETGLLKGVNLVKKLATNHFDQKRYGKEEEIYSMCWENEKYNKLCTGHKSGVIREFDINTKQFGNPITIPEYKNGTERLVGLYKHDNLYKTCTSSGGFRIWEPTSEKEDNVKLEVNVGPNVNDMAIREEEKTKFATGGKENPLQIWDCENPKEPIFKAKNVPHDWLQLRVPVWVTGVKFLKQSDKVVTCTGTSKIRVYDPTSPKRRPCAEMSFDEYPLNAMTLTNNSNQIIVGNTRGNMGMFDLRKKSIVHAFKGFAGSIRGLDVHPTLNYVASCGLDRFLRIHDINSGSLDHKVYLKSRLNCLLFSDNDFLSDAQRLQEEAERQDEIRKRELEGEESEEEEEEEVWKDMLDANDEDDANDNQSQPGGKESKKMNKNKKRRKKK